MMLTPPDGLYVTRRYQIGHTGTRFALAFDGGSSSSQASTSEQLTQSASGSGAATSGGNSSPVNTEGLQLNTGGDTKIVENSTTDPEAYQTIQNVVEQAIAATNQTQQAIEQGNSSANDAVAALATKVLNADQSTAANVATDGQTGNNSTLLWVVGILGAAAVLLGFGSKKS